MLAPLRGEGAEGGGDQVAAEETAQVGGVVYARDQGAEDADHQDIPPDQAGEGGVRAPAVEEQRSEEAAEGRRGAHRDGRGAAEDRDERAIRAHERRQEEPGSGGGLVDHERPGGAEGLARRREQVPQPVHVQPDVEQAAVEPAGAQQRVGLARREDRQAAGGAELEERVPVGAQEAERAAEPDVADAERQREEEQDRVGADQRREHPVAVEAEETGEAEERRVAAAAVQALAVADAHQLSAAGAEHRVPPARIEPHSALF